LQKHGLGRLFKSRPHYLLRGKEPERGESREEMVPGSGIFITRSLGEAVFCEMAGYVRDPPVIQGKIQNPRNIVDVESMEGDVKDIEVDVKWNAY